MACFALRDINISKMETRPSAKTGLGKAWEYVVYLDLDGGCDEDGMVKALGHLREFAEVRILGSYPRFSEKEEVNLVVGM